MTLTDRKKALLEILRDPEEQVRAAVSKALDRIEGMERLQNIFEAASTGEKPDRIRAIHFLGYLNTTESLDLLLTFFQDRDPEIRVATVKAIQDNLPCRAVVPLLGVLEDPDPSVVQEVLTALACFKDPKLTDFILPFLGSSDLQTACVAVQALGRNGDPKAEPHLVKTLMETTDPLLRAQTAEALGNLRPSV